MGMGSTFSLQKVYKHALRGLHGVGFEPTRISPADLKPATLTTRSSVFIPYWENLFKPFLRAVPYQSQFFHEEVLDKELY